MNDKWDTPPDGDFVRYLEQITAPAPGAVLRRAARPAPPMRHAPPAPTPFAQPAQRPAQAAHPAHAARPAPPQGPPDLAVVLRQLFGQLGQEMKKRQDRR